MRTLMVISLVVGCYVFVRGVLPLKLRWWWKVALGVVILAAAVCFEGMKVLGGGRIFAPVLPRWVMLMYTGAYVLLMVYFVFLFVAHVLSWMMMALPGWRRLGRERRRSWFNRVQGGLLVAAAVVCGVGMYNALCLPGVRELSVAADARLRVVMLSDLHADSIKGADYIRGVVERVNALGADVVVITGDFVDGSVAERGVNLAPLRELRARLGVYGVPGNHDYFSGYEEWLPYLSSLGVRMLNNEHVVLEEPGVVLAGVTDPAARLCGGEEPDVGKAVAGAPEGLPVILLAHQPMLAKAALELADLQLSGHTHGGQVLGLTLLTGAYNNGWYSGGYRVSERLLLYVSNGTSLWSGMPVRLGVPSEITLITLSPENKAL